MNDKIKDVIIGIIFLCIGISGFAFFVDVILIDGLSVDSSFLGSVIGGIIGTIGVAITTYWIIKTQNDRFYEQLDYEREKERRNFDNQVEITRFNLSQDVKVRQMQEMIQSLQNLKIYTEKYYMYTARLTEYYYLYLTAKNDYEKALGNGQNKEAELHLDRYYKAIDSYNKFLDKKASAQQIVYIEVQKIRSIHEFVQSNKVVIENFSKEIEQKFKEYTKWIDSKSFELLTMERINSDELKFTGITKEMLVVAYKKLDEILLGFKK